eukprot:292634-Amphidinium_carterae.1
MKLYVHYDDAWWINDLGLKSGRFQNANPDSDGGDAREPQSRIQNNNIKLFGTVVLNTFVTMICPVRRKDDVVQDELRELLQLRLENRLAKKTCLRHRDAGIDFEIFTT